MAEETGRDPGEQAAYDVARLLVAYPALRRIVEIAAMVGHHPAGSRGGRPHPTADRRADRLAAERPAPPYLRVRPA